MKQYRAQLDQLSEKISDVYETNEVDKLLCQATQDQEILMTNIGRLQARISIAIIELANLKDACSQSEFRAVNFEMFKALTAIENILKGEG